MTGDTTTDGTAMTLRIELFVEDLGASLAFYTNVLGFRAEHRGRDYASVRNGAVLFGLGLAHGLPANHHFSQLALQQQKGVGTEIVLEVTDVDAYHRRVLESGHRLAAPPRDRPWGARDFRIVDPDGYYLRVTSRTG
jgi:predicted enzyme related to lactoylglutathione lyase